MQSRHLIVGAIAICATVHVTQHLLAQAGHTEVSRELASINPTGTEAVAAWTALKSPETYLGYERSESFASRGGAVLIGPRSHFNSQGLRATVCDGSGDQRFALDAQQAKEIFHADNQDP